MSEVNGSMMFCLAIEHIGEFIVRELLYRAGREGIMSGLQPRNQNEAISLFKLSSRVKSAW